MRIVAQCTQEVSAAEVRPEHFAEVQLGVHGLPQHKSAHALLSGGANDEVRIWLSLGVEVRGDVIKRDRFSDLGDCSPGLGFFA